MEYIEDFTTQELLDELETRVCVMDGDAAKCRRLIALIMGLPQWYYSDKKRILEEVEKLF